MKKLLALSILLLAVVGSFGQGADVKIDGQGNVLNPQAINYATGKLKVNGVVVTTGGITAVTGTAPIVSSGGTTPAISITAATTSLPGSMSAADKTKLDGIAAGAQPGTVTSVAVSGANGIGIAGSPITTSGTIALSLGAITPTSVNGITLTTSTGTLTLGSVTLNAGPGGTLGTAAFTASSAYATSAQGVKADTAVQSLTVTTGSGVSGSFTSGTTPALSLTLGAITPSSVAAVGTVTGSNLSGTNTGDQTSIVGITGTLAQFNTAVTDANLVPEVRSISTTSPLSGGGDLSANRTFAIADAAADGTTKGASTFTAADFNATTGLISLDYTNAQKATGSVPGFLTAADWTTFNGKESALTFSTGLTRTTNTITVNTSQNIATLSNLTGNGFVKTSGGTGALSIDTTAYGTGTVTTFSAGDLSPLFTTTEATITTTPALSFALTNAAAHTIFGNFTGSSAAPSYNAVGTGVDTWMTTPSSANLRGALTDENGTGVALFDSATSPTFLTSVTVGATDPADAGAIRLENAATIAWEASPASTDVTLTVNSSEQFVFSNAILSPQLVTPTLGVASATTLGIGVVPTAALLEVNTGGTGSVNSARFLVPAMTSTNETDFYLGKAASSYQAVAFGYKYNTTPSGAFGYFTNYGDGDTAGISVTSGGYTGIAGQNSGTGKLYVNGQVGIGVLSPTAQLQVVATTEQMRLGYDASNYYSTTISSAGAVTLDAVGASASFTFNDRVINTVPLRLKNYTVATLPAGTQGDTAYVTDALAPTFLATIVGGGSVVTPVFYNGSAWVGY